MKRNIFLIMFLVIFYAANSQDVQSSRNKAREKRKNEMVLSYNALGAVIDSKNFHLQIENLLLPTHNQKKLNPLANYIMIDSSRCVWESESIDIPTDLFRQVSKVEGTIDGWKLEKDLKSYKYLLQFRMFTDNGLYRATLTIYPDKTFTGNINSVRDAFILYGRIVKH